MSIVVGMVAAGRLGLNILRFPRLEKFAR